MSEPKSEGRKKRSIRDIPLVKKTKAMEDAVEKEAAQETRLEMKRVKKQAKDIESDDVELAATKAFAEYDETDAIEQEEEAHFQEIKAKEKRKKARKTAVTSNHEEAGASIDSIDGSDDFDDIVSISAVTNSRRRRRIGGRGRIYAAIFTCLIVLFVLLQTVFAKANVLINAPAQNIPIERTTLENPIEYQAFTKNTEKKVTVSEVRTLAVNRKASGTITLYNNYSTEPYALVKSTRVQTDNGSIYRLTTDVIIPGKKTSDGKTIPGTVTSKVLADLPGSIYNAQAGVGLHLPGLVKGSAKYKGIYAKTSSNFVGGASGTTPDTGSAEITAAVASAKEEAETAAIEEFKASSPNKIILKDSIETTSSLGPITNSGEESSVSIRITTKAIGLAREDMRAAITGLLADKKMIPTDLGLENLKYEVAETTGKAILAGTFKVAVQGDVLANFAITPFDLRQLLARKSSEEANKVITETFIGATTEISIWPFWKNTLPDSDKIEIKIQ